MIQRIQSLYLLLTTLLSLLFLKGSFLTFFKNSGSIISISSKGIFQEVQGKGEEVISGSLPLYLLIIIIFLLSVVIILSFRNRKIQLWLSKILIVVISIFIITSVIYSLLIIKQYNATLIPGIKMGIPIAQLILSILAYRGINKDVDLIKSYDRLR